MAWNKLGTTTLSSAGDTITVSGMTANKFNVFLSTHFETGGTINFNYTFNNNTNSVYADRESINGASDTTNTSDTDIPYPQTTGDAIFFVNYVNSISGEEKLLIGWWCNSGPAGAGNAPSRVEKAGKFVPSPDADITRIDITNSQIGSYDTNTNLSALGSDLTEELNVQDGAIYYDTDLNKEYVLYNNTWTEI